MKEFWEEMKYASLAFIVFVIVIFVIPVAVVRILAQTDSGKREDIARCKSLQGEYGGGKCFKDGKGV